MKNTLLFKGKTGVYFFVLFKKFYDFTIKKKTQSKIFCSNFDRI